MKTLPGTLTLVKNLLSNTHPWFLLLDVEITTGTYLRFVRNTEEVTYNGNVYTPFPFEIGAMKHTSKGEIPSVQFRVCNINRIMQIYAEQYEGFVGSELTLRLVNAAYLTEDYAELTLLFEVMSCFTNSEWMLLECGAPNPMRKRFPLYRFIGSHCNFGFKSVECGYGGADATCDRTYDACALKFNNKRFGGYKGLVGGNIRIA